MTLGAAFGMSTSPYLTGTVRNPVNDCVRSSQLVNRPVPSCSELDVMKRDRFELLSAYLDGEVTPEERSLVQTWLNSDPTTKCLYSRLLALRQGLREESGITSCDAEVTLARVFRCLNQRFQMVSMASAGVVVVGVLNLLSSGMGAGDSTWQLSQTADSQSLQIALDQPVFPIPDLPVAVPVDSAAGQEQDGFLVESGL